MIPQGNSIQNIKIDWKNTVKQFVKNAKKIKKTLQRKKYIKKIQCKKKKLCYNVYIIIERQRFYEEKIIFMQYFGVMHFWS